MSGAHVGPPRDERTLIADIVLAAITDMRAPYPPERQNQVVWRKRHRAAVLWLGSSDSQEWLGLIGLKTTRVLKELQWHKYAKGLLRMDLFSPVLQPAERRLLNDGIRHMERIAEKVA